jgi:hypothetical protein
MAPALFAYSILCRVREREKATRPFSQSASAKYKELLPEDLLVFRIRDKTSVITCVMQHMCALGLRTLAMQY